MDNQAPYDCDGNLLGYPQYWCHKYHPGDDTSDLNLPAENRFLSEVYGMRKGHGVVWEYNDPFTTVLTFDGYGRGRSSAVFYWNSDEGRRYPMFMTDMTELLKTVDIVGAKTSPQKWIIRKRGQNYGIGLDKV